MKEKKLSNGLKAELEKQFFYVESSHDDKEIMYNIHSNGKITFDGWQFLINRYDFFILILIALSSFLLIFFIGNDTKTSVYYLLSGLALMLWWPFKKYFEEREKYRVVFRKLNYYISRLDSYKNNYNKLYLAKFVEYFEQNIHFINRNFHGYMKNLYNCLENDRMIDKSLNKLFYYIWLQDNLL